MLCHIENVSPFWITFVEWNLILKLQSNIDCVLDKPVLIPRINKPITY
jgi:hypothetical protein